MKRGLTAQIGAFLEEFPFVERHVANRNWIGDKPVVKRVDLELLDQAGRTAAFWRTRSPQDRTSTRFFLIDAQGNDLAELQPYDIIGWFGRRQEVVGETVGDAISKLNDSDAVGFILEITDIFGRDSKHAGFVDWNFGVSIVVHKPPKGRTFSQWLKEIPIVAKEQLKKEIAEADKV